MSMLKQLGDAQFKEGNFLAAIQFYTDALDSSPVGDNLTKEQERTILANRALTRLKYGSIYDALADCNLALSAEYTREEADKGLTAKLHLRRAKVKQIMTEYKQARADYEEFESLQAAIGRTVAAADRQVMDSIQAGLNIPKRSREMRRIWLIQAVQSRGILINMRSMDSFPGHQADFAGAGEVTSFDDNVSSTNYLHVPLSVLFKFAFPNLEDPQQPSRKLGGQMCVPEYAALGEYVEGIIQGCVIQNGSNRTWIRKALDHEGGSNAQILMMTKNGRFLSIPWDTKVGDIWPGARWPRTTPSPIRIMRKQPLDDGKRVDGFIFEDDFKITAFVVLNKSVPAFIKKYDDTLRGVGM